jgi:hypothetical protein
MNKPTLSLLLVLFSQFSFSQIKSSKNELSFAGFNYATYPFFHATYQGPFRMNVQLNAMYKRNLNDEIYLRLNQSYSNYTITEKTNEHNVGLNRQDIGREIYSSIGFENRYYQSKNKKVSIYSGFDITGFLLRNKNVRDLNGHFSTEKMRGIALQPFTGITYYLPRNLLLSFETSIILGVSGATQTENGYAEQIADIGAHGQLVPIRFFSIGYTF